MPWCLPSCDCTQQSCNQIVQKNVFQMCKEVTRILHNQRPAFRFFLVPLLYQWFSLSLLTLVSRRRFGFSVVLFNDWGYGLIMAALHCSDLVVFVLNYMRSGIKSVASRLTMKHEEKGLKWIKCKDITRCLLPTQTKRNLASERVSSGYDYV